MSPSSVIVFLTFLNAIFMPVITVDHVRTSRSRNIFSNISKKVAQDILLDFDAILDVYVNSSSTDLMERRVYFDKSKSHLEETHKKEYFAINNSLGYDFDELKEEALGYGVNIDECLAKASTNMEHQAQALLIRVRSKIEEYTTKTDQAVEKAVNQLSNEYQKFLTLNSALVKCGGDENCHGGIINQAFITMNIIQNTGSDLMNRTFDSYGEKIKEELDAASSAFTTSLTAIKDIAYKNASLCQSNIIANLDY